MAPAERPAGERPAKRARTDAQLAQKRQADRLKHKVNRAESKTRLENIEKDVSFLRETIGDLLSQLRQTQNALTRGSSMDTRPRRELEPSSSPPADAAKVAPYINNWLDTADIQDRSPPQSTQSSHHHPFQSYRDNVSVASSSSQQTTLVECHCGMNHNDQSECLELKSFTVLYESHKALSESPHLAIHIPKNPTLPNLMLHAIDDNPLTLLIGSTLQQYKLRNIETLFGIYLLTYRLLRWRMYPNQEWYNDVPELIKPTKIQDSVLHPVCIDFLPWPALRDYICQNQNTDSRQSVDLYLTCMQLLWPQDKELLCRNADGVVGLHPDFEATVCDVKCWQLTPEWMENFPKLAAFVS